MIILNVIIIFLLAVVVIIYKSKKIKLLETKCEQLQFQNDKLINDHKEGIHEFCNEMVELREKLQKQMNANNLLRNGYINLERINNDLREELKASENEMKQFHKSSMKFIARYNELKEHYQFLISKMNLPEEFKIKVPEDDIKDLEK